MNLSLAIPSLLLSLSLPQGGPAPRTQPASQEATRAAPVERARDILAASWSTDSVVRFDGETGAYEGTFTNGGPLRLPSGLDFGPDGNLYVSSFYWSSVLEYDGRTGAFVGTFIPSNTAGLNQASLLRFRPDGLLYVLASYDGGVFRFDADTGAFHDVFIPSGSGGVTTAFAMTFGPDGDIYLGGYYSRTIVRFDAQTGAPVNTVSEFINTPSGMAFGPDGVLYAGEWRSGSFFDHNVQRYTPDGDFLGQLTTLTQGPLDFMFGEQGRLYIAGAFGIDILDSTTGQWLGSMGQAGVENVMAVTFMPRVGN